jgi:transcription antitermination protein NusB
MKPRTRARAIALQVLYEMDHCEQPSSGRRAAHRLEETTLPLDLAEFARGIIFGVLPIRDHLDRVIAKYAPEWPLDQIAAIDRNILRMACWEFAISRETPVKVAINEAVELAKLYGSDSTARFVNGVLGTLADHEREIAEVLKNEIPHATNLES